MLPQTFFTGLLFASGLGGTLTLLLALAAPVLRRRYAARTLCTAWLLIALRLLIPFHISMDAAPVRLELPLPAAAASAHEQDAAERQPPAPGAAAAPAGDAQPNQPVLQSSRPALRSLLTANALVALWAAGAAALALRHWAGALLWRRRIQARSRPAGPELRLLWQRCCRRLGVRRATPVLESPAVCSPLVTGLLRPVLIVPCGMEPNGESELMLLHEGEHLRRRDLWAAVVLQAAVCLHWFNPAAWLLRSLARQEMEFACDQAVVRSAGPQSRSLYSHALLRTAARPVPGGSQFGGGKAGVKRRLRSLYHGGARRGTALLVCCTAAVAACGTLVACAAPGAQAPQSAGAAVAASGATASVPAALQGLPEPAGTAYAAFLSGDISLFDPADAAAWGLDSWNDTLLAYGELECACMDLDGDGTPELLVQCVDDPASYNGVFHYAGGRLYCWQSDSAEGSCRDYPLADGTMVRQYDWNGTRSYTVFRYQAGGQAEELARLFAREEQLDPASTEPCPYYEVNGQAVDPAEFEAQLNRRVTSLLPGRAAWTGL